MDPLIGAQWTPTLRLLIENQVIYAHKITNANHKSALWKLENVFHQRPKFVIVTLIAVLTISAQRSLKPHRNHINFLDQMNQPLNSKYVYLNNKKAHSVIQILTAKINSRALMVNALNMAQLKIIRNLQIGSRVNQAIKLKFMKKTHLKK